MEREDYYLTFITRVRAAAPEREALRAALERADPNSNDRATFMLLNVETLKDTAPAEYAWFKEAFARDLKATTFSQVRLRTSIGATAAMASHWAPALPLREATQGLVEAAIRSNVQAPAFQMFLRAVDHSWDEMLRAAPSIAQFSGAYQYDIYIERLGPHHAGLSLTGRDAVAFGAYILPGFLRGLGPEMGVSLNICIEEEDADFLRLSVRW